jgi:hypothetical protein
MSSIDYQNTVIYKIVCRDLSIKDLYVGSTTNFNNRKRGHIASCEFESNPSYNLKLYQFIRLNGGWDNWSMEEIERFPCDNSNEALTRERYWIETLSANLNSTKRPAVSRDERLDGKKQWYHNNREKQSARMKELAQMKSAVVCECGITIQRSNNLQRHQTTAVHQKRMAQKPHDEPFPCSYV